MPVRHRLAWLLVALVVSGPAAAEPLSLFAAGSLRAALGEVAQDFSERYAIEVVPAFGPSGLLRKRIEEGESAHLFASANLRHPRALEATGRGGPVALFARNKLCALARPGLAVESATLLEVLLDPEVRLGTSTPRADPSGDYAWELFDRAGALSASADEILKAKALQLTGGPESPAPPAGRNAYGWVMEEGRADIFLTYCTNALLARRELPDLQTIALPADLSVGADYGLIVLDGAPPEAWKLALYILSPAGQALLARHGFESGALPAGE